MKGLAVILVIFALIIWLMAHMVMPISYKLKNKNINRQESYQTITDTQAITSSQFSDFKPVENSAITETNPMIAVTINPNENSKYGYSVELIIQGVHKIYKAPMTPTAENRNRYFHGLNDSLNPGRYEVKVIASDDQIIQSTTWYFEIISDSTETVKDTEKQITPGTIIDEQMKIKLINAPDNIQPKKRVYDRFKFYKEMPLLANVGYSKLVYEYYYITGNDFDEAFKNVLEVTPDFDNGKAIAMCTIKPDISYKYYTEYNVIPKIKITEIKVTYQNKILLPYWDIPENVDENQLFYWNAFLKELWTHEYKHASISNYALKRIEIKLGEVGVSADLGFVGPELMEAYTKVDKAASKVVDDIWADACKQQNIFDNQEYGKLFTKIRYAKPK